MSKKDGRESNIEQKASASDCVFEIQIRYGELKSINKMGREKKVNPEEKQVRTEESETKRPNSQGVQMRLERNKSASHQQQDKLHSGPSRTFQEPGRC